MIKINLGKEETNKIKNGPTLNELIERIKDKLPKNFKAKSVKKQKLDWKELVGIGIATAVALLPYLFVAQYKSFVQGQHELQMQKYAEREAQLRAEITRYQSFQRELESYEKQKKLIKERLMVVRQLLEARNTPVNAFDAIGQSLPEKAWLNAIELHLSPKPGINISGAAYTNEDVSDYVDKLSESVQLKDVMLESVSSTRGEKDMEIKQFQVGAAPAGQLALIEPQRETAAANPNPGKAPPKKQ